MAYSSLNYSIERRHIRANKHQLFGQWKADGVSANFVKRKKWQYVTYKCLINPQNQYIYQYIPMK